MTPQEEVRAAALQAAVDRVAPEQLWPQSNKDTMVSVYARKYEKFIKTGEWDG